MNYKRSNTRKIAFIRVSNERQNTARLRKALKEAGCKVFYEDRMSGKDTECPELQRMLKELHHILFVIVLELDLLANQYCNTDKILCCFLLI
ncbi:recombinase family protein [Bacillus cereus]|uniref:recombinase family protein n=1 Tax=Bacillus cereus TaxID=1396 RepID=UPI00119D0CC9|nr:recombinase family protein [Bacillus cereus]